MRKAKLLLVLTTLGVLGSTGTVTVPSFADSVSKTRIFESNALKKVVFQDDLKNGLDNWNKTGYITANVLGVFLSGGATITLKTPIHLDAGTEYSYSFIYGTTGPHSLTHGSILISSVDGNDQDIQGYVMMPADVGTANLMSKTFTPKQTGDYNISFLAGANENDFLLYNFKVEQK